MKYRCLSAQSNAGTPDLSIVELQYRELPYIIIIHPPCIPLFLKDIITCNFPTSTCPRSSSFQPQRMAQPQRPEHPFRCHSRSHIFGPRKWSFHGEMSETLKDLPLEFFSCRIFWQAQVSSCFLCNLRYQTKNNREGQDCITEHLAGPSPMTITSRFGAR